MSIFAPYKALPPDGAMLPSDDETCDPVMEKCKTQVFVYESKCLSCGGTGFVKTSHRRRSGTAHLSTCLLCHGLGYVRRTTARFLPESTPESGDHTAHTIARPPRDDAHNSLLARLARRKQAPGPGQEKAGDAGKQ
ncbi:hypothetical protein HYH03_005506 [Edaphochlamys debaryana]|uniref:Uncharacterized protein n=1 Tax=Edaphochlamys debaryana TaxID=47281 RepID=A0A836C242_9CHLO|nr:hypothetical protein HYH03_005506 [Edaphochlamys debaryana]|eukprot:KAG2496273.1 hypothetical protein HYH03_005506 [Edaphochlamys debaryana]